jgi:integrase/recombinase XerC
MTAPPKYLTQSEVAAFFAAIPRTRPRDRLLFAMIYRYGLRTCEAITLPADAVNMVERTVAVQGRKGGTFRMYRLFEDLIPLARKHRPGPTTYFVGTRGPLKSRRIVQMFREYARAAGLHDARGTHALRHSAAVHVLDAGGTLADAGDLLRHRDLRTTQVYAACSVRRRNDYQARLEASSAVVKL